MCSSAFGMVRIGMSAMSGGLTLSSRPQVSSVGAASLCITAHGSGRSEASIAAVIAANAALPYMRRAAASVSGSVASCQRSSISSSVTRAWSYTIDLSQSTSRCRVGSSTNSCSSRMPSLGLGLKMLVPMPPIVTSRPMRSGLRMAKLMPTPPPMELPTMCDLVHAERVQERRPRRPGAVTIGWPPKSSTDPEAGKFQDQAAVVRGERRQYPAEVAPAA